MRLVFIIAFLSFFTACSSGEPEDSKNESEDRMQTFLGEFPEKQFLSISLGQDKQTAENILKTLMFFMWEVIYLNFT